MAALLAILLMAVFNPVAEVDSFEIDSVWFGSPPAPKASSKAKRSIWKRMTSCFSSPQAATPPNAATQPAAGEPPTPRLASKETTPHRPTPSTSINNSYSQPSTFPPISPCSTPTSNNVLGTSYTCCPSSIIEAAAHSPVSSFPSLHAAKANHGQLSDDDDIITIDCQRDQPPSPWVGNAYLFSRSGKAVDSCNGDVVLTAAEWEQIQRRRSEHEQCVLNFEQCQRELETMTLKCSLLEQYATCM
eukprot:gene2212-33771_t